MRVIDYEIGEKIKEFFYLEEKEAEKRGGAVKGIRISRGRLRFGEMIRKFIESMSSGMVDLELTCFLWDTILLKRMMNLVHIFLVSDLFSLH